ncbi:MAG: NAD-dependent epimerase/dehydratase family protein [Daejeonella sp.]
MMQTILGANGTIGTLLANELRTYTNHIRLVSRNPVKVNDSDVLFPADLTNAEMVDKAIEGSDVVYLVVGFDYQLKVWQEKWPQLMRTVLDSCIRHKAKLVFFDNMYMYDVNSLHHMTEDSVINSPSEKGKVRQEIAEMLMHEVHAGRLDALIARSADFYGPNNEKSLLFELVYKNIKKGKKPNWFIDPDKIHSFTYTPDAAKATAMLGNTEDAYNQVWHLPTDKSQITGREMIGYFCEEMHAKKKGIFILPTWMLKLLGLFIPIMREMPEMMYQYKNDYFFDSSKFDKKFNFETTSYREGVKQTVELTAE